MTLIVNMFLFCFSRRSNFVCAIWFTCCSETSMLRMLIACCKIFINIIGWKEEGKF